MRRLNAYFISKNLYQFKLKETVDKMVERLDIIVFGATGYTGKFTLTQVIKLSKTDGRTLTWGIAGRSEEKLKKVLVESAKRAGVDNHSSVPIVISDVVDEESIKKMTARARIIINCCGPYHLYGEVVVKACIETSTHYVDVCPEPLFIEQMQEKYHKAAEEKGVFIVSACGFDSIPADLGIIFLENNFQGILNSVEIFLHGYEEEKVPGPAINFGTWETIAGAVGKYREFLAFKRNRNLKPLPEVNPKLSMRFPKKSEIVGLGKKWIIPVIMPDRYTVLLSNQFFYEQDNRRPIQIHSYLLATSFLTTLQLLFFGMIYVILTQFKFGRYLLLKYPRLFSCGYFAHENPSEDRLERQKFFFILYGKGWGEKLADGANQYESPPNKKIIARVSGTNPAYGFTCIALTLSAIVILTEPEKLPSRGGVYSPASVFSKTSLIEQLHKNGATFDIIGDNF